MGIWLTQKVNSTISFLVSVSDLSDSIRHPPILKLMIVAGQGLLQAGSVWMPAAPEH
jgi:hypothetical protein